MGLLDDMKAMLAQYASGGAPAGDTGAHFRQVAESVDAGTLAQGIAGDALRSDATVRAVGVATLRVRFG
jgi:hypothetical protein